MVVSEFTHIMFDIDNNKRLAVLLLVIFCFNCLRKSDGLPPVQYVSTRAGLVDVPRDIPCNVKRIILHTNVELFFPNLHITHKLGRDR